MDNYDVEMSNDKDVKRSWQPLKSSNFKSRGFKVSNLNMCLIVVFHL